MKEWQKPVGNDGGVTPSCRTELDKLKMEDRSARCKM